MSGRSDWPSGDYDAPWERGADPPAAGSPEVSADVQRTAGGSPEGLAGPQRTPDSGPRANPAEPTPANRSAHEPDAIFTPARWLLLLASALAVLPLWSAARRGLLGYVSPAALRAEAHPVDLLVCAFNGSFGYSEWTGAILVGLVLALVAGRVERCWGSGVLACAFLFGGGFLNAIRIGLEAGEPSLLAISGGWTGAAVVLGLAAAIRDQRGVWLTCVGFLILVGVEGGSGAPLAVALGGLFLGFGLGHALRPSYSAEPTARGCLLILAVVVGLGLIELTALVRSPRTLRIPELFSREPAPPQPPASIGPLTTHTVPRLELSLNLPSGWRQGRDDPDKPYVVFRGDGNAIVWVWRAEVGPFSRDPDTFLLRYVIARIGAEPNAYEGEEVVEEARFSGDLGRGYRVTLRSSFRFTDDEQRGTRCSYAWIHDDEFVWIDCFLPDAGHDDPQAYARQLFDSIAPTVRLSEDEGPK